MSGCAGSRARRSARRSTRRSTTPISGRPRLAPKSPTCSTARRWSSPASSRRRNRRCNKALPAPLAMRGIDGERLNWLIGRIERLEEEKKALAADIKEVYAEAKGTGFDTNIMRQVIRLRRMDQDDLDEQETLLDVYKRALGMVPDLPTQAAAE